MRLQPVHGLSHLCLRFPKQNHALFCTMQECCMENTSNTMYMLYSRTAYAQWPLADAWEEEGTSFVPHINPHRARVMLRKKNSMCMHLYRYTSTTAFFLMRSQRISVSTGLCPITTNSTHSEGPPKRVNATPRTYPWLSQPSTEAQPELSPRHSSFKEDSEFSPI